MRDGYVTRTYAYIFLYSRKFSHLLYARTFSETIKIRAHYSQIIEYNRIDAPDYVMLWACTTG